MTVNGDIAGMTSPFLTVDSSSAQSELSRLLNTVSGNCGRVTITGPSPDTACVLISEKELNSLEQAIAILSTTAGAESMRDEISALAARFLQTR